MPVVSHAEMRALRAAALYTPAALRRAHLKRMQELIITLDPTRLYTYEYVFHRITRFKPDRSGSVLLTGTGLVRDLGRMLLEISKTCPLDGADADIVPANLIARECRVAAATVRRWAAKGLPLAYFALDGRRAVLGATRQSLASFQQLRKERPTPCRRRTTDKERNGILAQAESLRKDKTLSETALVQHLAKAGGRSTATIRRILARHEEASSSAGTQARSSIPAADRDRLIVLYRDGTPVRDLAGRFGLSPSAAYRILHNALVHRASALKIKYIPSPEFAEHGAKQQCLGDEGLFTYPPEFSEAPLKAPDGLPPYLRALYKIPLLSREEEQRLFRKYNYIKYRMAMLQEEIRQKGYRTRLLERFTEWAQAADAVQRILIRCNLRLVVSIAKRHVGRLTTLFDLVSEGNMCIIRAVKCYDYRREARFATYATWAITKHFARVVPETNYRFSGFVTDGDEMLAHLGDLRPDPQVRNETLAHIRTVLAHAAEHLTERERHIIASHYGTDGRPPRTLEQIGGVFGLTRERIRQIEARALKKLREILGPDTVEQVMS